MPSVSFRARIVPITVVGLLLPALGPPAGGAGAEVTVKATGPWDLGRLRRPPRVTVLEQDGALTSLYYEGEPYRGKPTRVFAYLARPEKVEGKLPAMVLVHGGGGTAFKQ